MLERELRGVGAARRAKVRDLRLAAPFVRDHRDGGDRLGRFGMHGEHRKSALAPRSSAVDGRREEEDEEVEAVIKPGLEQWVRRRPGQTRAQLAELGRPLERHQEAGIGARQIIRDGELRRDGFLQDGRTGRRCVASTTPGLWLRRGFKLGHDRSRIGAPGGDPRGNVMA
jgi:hypothetical protein